MFNKSGGIFNILTISYKISKSVKFSKSESGPGRKSYQLILFIIGSDWGNNHVFIPGRAMYLSSIFCSWNFLPFTYFTFIWIEKSIYRCKEHNEQIHRKLLKQFCPRISQFKLPVYTTKNVQLNGRSSV